MSKKASLPPELTSTPARPLKQMVKLQTNFEHISPILPPPLQKRPKSMIPVRKTNVQRPQSPQTISHSKTNISNGNVVNSPQTTGTMKIGSAPAKALVKGCVVSLSSCSPEVVESRPKASLKPLNDKVVSKSPATMKISSSCPKSSTSEQESPRSKTVPVISKALPKSTSLGENENNDVSILKNNENGDQIPVWDFPKRQKKSLSLKKKSSLFPLQTNRNLEEIPEEQIESNEDLSPFYIPDPPQNKRMTYVVKMKSPSSDGVDIFNRIDVFENTDTKVTKRRCKKTATSVSSDKKKPSSIECPLQNHSGPLVVQAVVHDVSRYKNNPTSNSEITIKNNEFEKHSNNQEFENKREHVPLSNDVEPMEFSEHEELSKNPSPPKKRGRPKKEIKSKTNKENVNKVGKSSRVTQLLNKNSLTDVKTKQPMTQNQPSMEIDLTASDTSNKPEETANAPNKIKKKTVSNKKKIVEKTMSPKPESSVKNTQTKKCIERKMVTAQSELLLEEHNPYLSSEKPRKKKQTTVKLKTGQIDSPNKELMKTSNIDSVVDIPKTATKRNPQNKEPKIRKSQCKDSVKPKVVKSTVKSQVKAKPNTPKKKRTYTKKGAVLNGDSKNCDPDYLLLVETCNKAKPTKRKAENFEVQFEELVKSEADEPKKKRQKKAENFKVQIEELVKSEADEPKKKRKKKIDTDEVLNQPTLMEMDEKERKNSKSTKSKAISKKGSKVQESFPECLEVQAINTKIGKSKVVKSTVMSQEKAKLSTPTTKKKYSKKCATLDADSKTNNANSLLFVENPKKARTTKIKTENVEDQVQEHSEDEVHELVMKRQNILVPDEVLNQSTLIKRENSVSSKIKGYSKKSTKVQENSSQCLGGQDAINGKEPKMSISEVLPHSTAKPLEVSMSTENFEEEELKQAQSSDKQSTDRQQESTMHRGRSRRRSQSREPEEVLLDMHRGRSRRRSQSREPEEVLLDQREFCFGFRSPKYNYPLPGITEELHLLIKGCCASGKYIIQPGAAMSSTKRSAFYSVAKGQVKVRILDQTHTVSSEDHTNSFVIMRGNPFFIKNESQEPVELNYYKFQ